MLQGLKRKLIKGFSKFYDPLVTLNIGNQSIKIPLSHDLQDILKLYPDYNFNLSRIVKYASEQLQNVKVIDIGANVGDTVAFIKNYSDVPVLCIDGDEKYMKILRENTAQYKNVYSCRALVGGETKEVNLKLKSEKGTAYLEKGGDAVPMRTLENILLDFPEFKSSKIIKIDTDGFDTIILRSCSDYLRNAKPVLFFEFVPELIKKNNDDAFEFINFLQDCDYQYFIFYMNNGDYLLSCSGSEKEIIKQIVNYFSGRDLNLFADICAFTSTDKHIFEYVKEQEIRHFRQIRNY
jgi:FkbM family methyltransferase